MQGEKRRILWEKEQTEYYGKQIKSGNYSMGASTRVGLQTASIRNISLTIKTMMQCWILCFQDRESSW